MESAAFKREDIGDGTAVLAVTGELDVSNAHELGRRVEEIVADGFRGVILDLGELMHLDSSGLAQLITAQQRTAAHGAKLVLAFDSSRLRRTIEVRGLDGIFTIVATRDDALATLTAG